MLEVLRAWLNGKREYWAGVVLYKKMGDDDRLKQLFAKGPTAFTTRRMQEELLAICNELKKQPNAKSDHHRRAAAITHKAPAKGHAGSNFNYSGDPEGYASTVDEKATNSTSTFESTKLYAAAKAEADKAYKEMMNKRAILFSLAPLDDRTEANTEARIEARRQLALDVVQEYEYVSQLYDRADHVRIHGVLPDAPVDDEEELNVDELPDHLVKPTLDNIRKNVNKIKKREQTAERVSIIQKHEANIEKLLHRWNALKPK
jgi:hypothetical protein